MKTKKSKRLFAALLSLVMVISTFAAIPFSSFASTYSLDALNTLMSQYETKIKEGTYYNNTLAAYKAWYDAKVVYVGVKAGKTADTAIDTAYTNLSNAITNLTAFTPKKGTAVPKIGSSTTTIPTDMYANVLYSNGSSATTYTYGAEASTGGALNYGCTGYTYYPETTLLYDGTAPHLAILTGCNNPKRYKVQPAHMAVTTSGVELKAAWKGVSDGFRWPANTHTSLGYTSDDYGDYGYQVKKSSTFRTYGNTLYYSGTPTTTLTTISSTNWHFGIKRSSKSATFTNSTAIYVVNYKSLIDAVKGVGGIDVTKYPYSSMVNLFTAMDGATSFDPNTYFTQSNNASGCASKIDTHVSNITTAKNALSSATAPNYASYVSYAEHYAAYKTVADGNNSNGYYTTESFGSFKTAHEQAGKDLDAIINKSAYMTNISSADTALTTKYNGLVAAESYIDDTELRSYISQYYQLTKSYYTTSTYDALTAKVNAALVYYNDGSYTAGITLKDNETDTAIYNT